MLPREWARAVPARGQASTLRRGFEAAEIKHVRREQNKEADALANRAMDLQESHLAG